MSARRVAQIHAALTPQLRARQAGVGERQRGIKKKDRGPIDRSKHYNSRLLLTNALRLTSDAMIQIAAKVYRLEHVDSPDGEFIRTLIPQLDAGEMTLHQAGNRYETWLKQQSLTITTESEQRQIISAATTQLRAIVNGLRPIGDINIRIKKEEAIKWLTELQLANQQIRKTVKQLTKRLG